MIGIVKIALARPYTFVVMALLILILGPLVGSLAMTALRLRVEARSVANPTPARDRHDRAPGPRHWASFRDR